MHKPYYLILAAALALALAGCGGAKPEGSTPAETISTTAAATLPAETTEPSEAIAANTVAEAWEQAYTLNPGTVTTQVGEGYTARYVTPPESEQITENGQGMAPFMETVTGKDEAFFYYYLDEDALVPLEVQTFSGDCEANGAATHVSFTYVASGKEGMPVSALSDCRILNADSLDWWLLELHLPVGDGTYYNYPVFLNVSTGEFTDAFQGLDVTPFATSPYTVIFGQGQVVVQTREENPKYYLYDTADAAVYSLDELTGSTISGCSVLPETEELLCWDNSGNLFRISQGGTVCTQELAGAEILYAEGFNGQTTGSSFVILREDGQRICYDAATGERFALELNGLSLTEAHLSVDGRELRWDRSLSDGTLSALNVSSQKLTVLHLQNAVESGQMLAFYTFS